MQKTLELFQRIATNLLEQEKENPTSEYISTEKLYETLDLSLKEAPLSEEEFEAALQDLVFATPKTASPTFFNQHVRNPYAYSLAMQWVTRASTS